MRCGENTLRWIGDGGSQKQHPKRKSEDTAAITVLMRDVEVTVGVADKSTRKEVNVRQTCGGFL